MQKNNRKPSGSEKNTVQKPFMTGDATDENTLKSALAFFGILIMIVFVAFIACVSASFGNQIIKIVINTAVIFAEMMILYNNGAGRGAEAVALGEIIYQKKEKGQDFSKSEKSICYHPAKGFLNGFMGTLPFLLIAVILAVNTTVQYTASGALPSWMGVYTRREDIGNALVSYTQPEGMSFVDILRTMVRIIIIPFVNIAGADNKIGLFIIERISPLIILLPALSYGTGYLKGKTIRAKIHTTISENEKKRVRKERIRKKTNNRSSQRKGPEQLN